MTAEITAYLLRDKVGKSRKEQRSCASIVVAGFPPARKSDSFPKAGVLCRDRASSALSLARRHRHSRPVIEKESAGVWVSHLDLSIRSGARYYSAARKPDRGGWWCIEDCAIAVDGPALSVASPAMEPVIQFR